MTVAPLMTVLVGMTAGAVMAAPIPATEAPALTPASPPLVGRTPALSAIVPRLPRPTVTQASTAAPLHDAETAVMVFPLMTVLVGTTSPLVSDTPGRRVALAPALTRSPLGLRASAPRVMVPRGPRPSETHASTRPPTPHD